MKITAVAATLNHFFLMGVNYSFSLEQLQKLADTAQGVPIEKEFDPRIEPIGRVICGFVLDGELVIHAEIFGETSIAGWYIVPGCSIPAFKAFSFGLTTKPCDKSLQPI